VWKVVMKTGEKVGVVECTVKRKRIDDKGDKVEE
jgi:hypothetical protein